ncbi:MAG: hypothetical protein ACYDAK_13030 [Candidatus Limnocylindrales bacterium]
MHTGIGAVVFVTVAAIIGFNVVRIGAAMLAKQSNPLAAKTGKALGATVTFGG